MGGSSSTTNIVQNSVSMLSEVYNSSVQQCMSSQAQSIGITIINSAGTTIDNNQFEQLATSSTTCVQKVAYDTTLSNSLDASVKQQAAVSSSMMRLQVASDSSTNITRNTMMLANIIKNSATQQCTPSSLQSFMLNIINSPGSTFSKNVVKQSTASVIDCVQGVATRSSAANDMKLVFDQVAKNSQETLSGVLEMLIILAVVVVLGFVVVGGTGGTVAIKQMLDWKTLLAAGTVVVIILGAYLWYQSESQKVIRDNVEVKAKTSNDAFETNALDVLARISGDKPLNGINGGQMMPKDFDTNGLPRYTAGSTDAKAMYQKAVGYYWWDPSFSTENGNTPVNDIYHFNPNHADYPGPQVGSIDKDAATGSQAGNIDRTGAFPKPLADGSLPNPRPQASYIRQWAEQYGCSYEDNECDWSIVWRSGPSKALNLRRTIAKLLKAQESAVPATYDT